MSSVVFFYGLAFVVIMYIVLSVSMDVRRS